MTPVTRGFCPTCRARRMFAVAGEQLRCVTCTAPLPSSAAVPLNDHPKPREESSSGISFDTFGEPVGGFAWRTDR